MFGIWLWLSAIAIDESEICEFIGPMSDGFTSSWRPNDVNYNMLGRSEGF